MKVIATLLILVMCLGGCASDPALSDRVATLKYTEPEGAGKPDMRPSDWERIAIAKYHAPTNAGRDNMTQKEFRDSVIYRELSADDDHFGQFVRDLRSGRAVGNISADLASIILNGLGVVTGGVGTKRTLAALSGGMIGAKGSVEKELFNQEAMTAIIARMKAARLQALVPIKQGLALGIGDYPLEQGLFDLRGYANAGTLSGTLAAITDDAGEQARDAGQQIRRVTRGADYRASFDERDALSGRIRNMTDAQVMTLAATMLPRLGERPAEVQAHLQTFDPNNQRLANASAARKFLLQWIIQDSAASEMKQWSDAIVAAGG